ncbi:MAG: DNA mismatch repair protein MutS [Clostridia bacterium]|nr:DNA mismatch repair protein MutS [Clostridia bacterium]
MALSPMMQQYQEIKKQYPDALIFYRLGDFYEMFFDDAKTASKELELTLTGRDCGLEERAPMCGVPYHAADGYIGKLVGKGYKIVICEQVEDPKLAQGLVKRDVVRIVTPGTVTDNTQLNENEHNYICGICILDGVTALAAIDVSTGDVNGTCFSSDCADRIVNELAVYTPREVIFNVSCDSCGEIRDYVRDRLHAKVYDRMPCFDRETAIPAFSKFIGNTSQYPDEDYPVITAIGGLVSYIAGSLCSSVFRAKNVNIYREGQYLSMDSSTRRNLELCRAMRDGEKKGSLLWVLDRTKTAVGGRLLRQFIEQPLVNQRKILRRQGAVAELYDNYILRSELQEVLSGAGDLERLMTRVCCGTAGGKELRAIANTLKLLPQLRALIAGCESEALKDLYGHLDPLIDLCGLLDSGIKDDPPFSIREGGFIKEGYSAEVDRCRDIMYNSGALLKKIEEREKERLGTKNVRVGYTKVFGYYIEISKAANSAITLPADYIRRQTLTTGERYITEELKQLETTILSAADKDAALELELFGGFCAKLTEQLDKLRAAAAFIAEIDVYASLSSVAADNGYVCPEVTYGDEIVIKDGRHPVVEKFMRDAAFVPNDTRLDTRYNKLLIITGPNMAGKSTYMRQVALITLMAQIGSFVPASEAQIGIVDKLFTRIGASDDLSSGTSTFMLEMNEVAAILKNATKRSLIIYDEIGRGTSTYDGMSIAKAVADYTASKKLGAKTLFATHYHELTAMASPEKGIVNCHIAAKKKGDTLVFLRKILPGAADDSYGIEVAKLAGVPAEVIKDARTALKELEEKGVSVKAPETKESDNMTIDNYLENSVCEKIRSLQTDMLTPLESLTILYELKKMLG